MAILGLYSRRIDEGVLQICLKWLVPDTPVSILKETYHPCLDVCCSGGGGAACVLHMCSLEQQVYPLVYPHVHPNAHPHVQLGTACRTQDRPRAEAQGAAGHYGATHAIGRSKAAASITNAPARLRVLACMLAPVPAHTCTRAVPCYAVPCRAVYPHKHACVRACVRACMRACACARVRASLHACVCVAPAYRSRSSTGKGLQRRC